MKAKNIEDALHITPFKPFEIELDNGKKFTVKHPEFVMLNQSKTTAVIGQGDNFHIVDTDHISCINLLKSH